MLDPQPQNQTGMLWREFWDISLHGFICISFQFPSVEILRVYAMNQNLVFIYQSRTSYPLSYSTHKWRSRLLEGESHMTTKFTWKPRLHEDQGYMKINQLPQIINGIPWKEPDYAKTVSKVINQYIVATSRAALGNWLVPRLARFNREQTGWSY